MNFSGVADALLWYHKEIFSCPIRKEARKSGAMRADKVARKIFYLLVEGLKNTELFVETIQRGLLSMSGECSDATI